jgi:hypothetical protein
MMTGWQSPWWLWRSRKTDYPASVWARLAVKRVLARRDLPGLKSGTDVWDRLTPWQGAAMEGLVDRRPGPERLAESKEWFAKKLEGSLAY